MLPVTVHTHISATREDVYDFLVDLAARVAFTDHYQEDFRLTSPRSVGVGAGARFKVRGQWAELVIAEAARPRLVAEEGGLGRLGGTRLYSEFELARVEAGLTRVELTTWTEPGSRLAALREAFGARRWFRRRTRAALERLRRVFEEQRDAPLARATVAGYEPGKAPRFGVSPRYGGAAPQAGARD